MQLILMTSLLLLDLTCAAGGSRDLRQILQQVSSSNAGNSDCTTANGRGMCRSVRRCIALSQFCDGQRNCPDGSDEEDCPGSTCSHNEFKCANGQCILTSWKCDGERDCAYGEDEEGCSSSAACRANEFKCQDGTCIQARWKCDGQRDCPNGDDELNCQERRTCPEGLFACTYGCVPALWRCDGERDCQHGEDEVSCPDIPCSRGNRSCRQHQSTQCRSTEFKCSGGTCISSTWECDGEMDCPDGDDEHTNCTTIHPRPCAGFLCANGLTCINSSWRCDNDVDCPDNSDEEGCPACSGFPCRNGQCVSANAFCDGTLQCSDGSDEESCNKCSSGQRMCRGVKKCVPESAFCNGSDDCGDGSDELDCGN